VQASALLKNVDGTLPYKASDMSGKTIAIIGPNTNLSKADTSYYGPRTPCDGQYWTLVDAVSQHAAANGANGVNVVSALGVPSVSSTDTSGIAAAVAMAKDADAVILAVGTDLTWAHEEHDASSIKFTDAQLQLMQQVAAAAKKPVVVITMTATPLDISAILSDNNVGAILHVGQPSVTILGVGELLFGKSSPAGRTVQTIYPGSYQDEISIFDFNMRPGPSSFPRPDCSGKNGTNPGRTHRFYTGKAVVPFGFGLSYTTFSYSPASSLGETDEEQVVSLDALREVLASTKEQGRTFPSAEMLSAKAPLVNYFVDVKNTGNVDSDDVVLGFLVPPGAGENGVPLQTLFGFERVHVPAGQTVRVNIYPAMTDFAHTLLDGTKVPAVGDWKVKFGLKETLEHGQGYAEMKLSTV